MGDQGESEFLLELPEFVEENAEVSIGNTIYLMQLSFKTFVETFKVHTTGYVDVLKDWMDCYNKLIVRYQS
jgi:hypothetical protein